jgi:hypothetical protein
MAQIESIEKRVEEALVSIDMSSLKNLKLSPLDEIKIFFQPREDKKDILIFIRDILSLSEKDIEKGDLLPFKKTLVGIQQKLKSFGFKAKDWAFMKIDFDKMS